jgi:putative nucleotidyltransferase with HDIG domain
MSSRRPISRRSVFLAVALSVLLATPQTSRADQAAAGETRERAWDALRSKLQEKKYLDHSLAVEAIIRELAVAEGDDRDEWGVAGLLHDIDIGTTAADLSRHGLVGAQILRDLGFSEAVVHAVAAHDDRPGVARTSRLDHAVYCADQLYWLVGAAGAGFGSGKLNTADPEDLWAQVQAIPAKRAVAAKVSAECAVIGFSMPRAFAAVQAASRKLAPKTAAP